MITIAGKFKHFGLQLLLAGSLTVPALANIPGGGTGTGANVTLTDNGSTVTIANGIISILCTKSGATINQINYTFNNNGSSETLQLLNGGTDGGEFYWETGGFSSGSFTYSVVSNTASYVEIDLFSTSATNGALDIHFSMLKGSPGFYVTPIWFHRGADLAMSMGETRDNIYAGSIFNWMCADATRSRLMEVSGGSAIGVLNAPVEVSLWTNGIYQGQYEDKYKYSANFGVQRAWGWCSVGSGGKNVGLWNVSSSMEYHAGGPMKRELMDHIGTTILNMLNSSHYGSGANDSIWGAGEVWSKAYGPYFIYCNNVTNTLTDMTQASTALRNDAVAQAAAEQTAWPYSWFGNTNYVPASGRGAITGQIVISDTYNPNASAANLWVGAIQQPVTVDGIYDFQEWMKTCQFWVQTDTNGNFTIPNVIAGTNYTLYAFGLGAAGMFQSQNQSGGNTPNTFNLPTTQFSVSVTNSATNNLGTVTWTPTRAGPTVFELGYPDRSGEKFRHGDDYWVSDIGPSNNAPSPIWSKHLEYPFEFPSGANYVVGQSRWTTDWNLYLPVVADGAGNFDNPSATITFNLASAPVSGAQASFYLALCSDYEGAIIIQINGSYITSSTGYYVNWAGSSDESDCTIRQGLHAAYSDARTSFAGSLLKAGQNTITISLRQVGGSYFADHAMYDYVRLELAGYVPPPPASVTAYPGNHGNLVCWPVTPGATSYNILASTSAAGPFVSITNGVLGPICGSGTNNNTYLDATAVNGTTYYYQVQSVNHGGTSAVSPTSPGATPSASLSTSAPTTPTGLTATPAGFITTPGVGQVTLNWTASPGANFYSIQRSTVVNNGDGTNVILGTTLLNNTNTSTSYVDSTPTSGSLYLYAVSAVSAGGASSNSPPVLAKPVPPPPAVAPGGLTAGFVATTNVALKWATVTGAIGYLVQRSTATTNAYILLGSVTETNYTDYGLSPTTTYYYKITPVNAGGVANASVVSLNGPPPAPASLSAVAGYEQVTLSWPAATGATSYILRRGTSSGNESFTVVSGYTGTSYTNISLVNSTTYYYVVAATGTYGTGTNSTEAHATPSISAAPVLVWTGVADMDWDTTSANWLLGGNATSYTDGDSVMFTDSPANTDIFIAGSASPASVTFLNSNVSYTLSASGNGISGATSVVKTNAGPVTFASANTYTGGTTVNGGALWINNPSGSGSGTGNISVNSGGQLGGNGIISGATTVNVGGWLAPGNPFGPLTFSNTLTLVAGSTTLLEVQHLPLNNGSLSVSNTFVGLGALIVSNAGVTPFVAGDSFTLFNAQTYIAAFSSVNLPALPAGLGWNTNALENSGTLSVVVTASPQFQNVALSGGSLVFSGSGGVSDANYYILASTDLTLPLNSWTVMATNTFDVNGNFIFTNTPDPIVPQSFYQLQVP